MIKEQVKGYVAVTISPEAVKALADWSIKAIPEENLFWSEVNGKKEGGNVIDDAHLTLFFGLNDELINKKEIEELIKTLSLSELEIVGVKAFPVPQIKCKILYFIVNDDKGLLQRIHDEFLKMPHYEEDQKPFKPHITIAYVKESFNEKGIEYNGLNKVTIKGIEYIKFNSKENYPVASRPKSDESKFS